MKKKIALIMVMVISLFCLISGQTSIEVYADAHDITSVSPPSPHP